jgi:hypothetical protein
LNRYFEIRKEKREKNKNLILIGLLGAQLEGVIAPNPSLLSPAAAATPWPHLLSSSLSSLLARARRPGPGLGTPRHPRAPERPCPAPRCQQSRDPLAPSHAPCAPSGSLPRAPDQRRVLPAPGTADAEPPGAATPPAEAADEPHTRARKSDLARRPG